MEKKTLAVIAHDNKKDEICAWAYKNREHLKQFNLIGTGHTAALVSEKTGLEVQGYLSGPLGGDQQIGSLIAEGKVDFVVFFWDPLQAQPHDPDVKALLRIATVYDIPLVTTPRGADILLSSPLL